MTPETKASDALARFHRTLVEEILKVRPTYLREPFTVAEIYQNLVPYRTHRDRIGVEMNGDYEDTLLRLLAGEGEYLTLESEHARREINEELRSANPNTGLYRDFAAVDVRLNPLRMPRDIPDPEPGVAVGPDLFAAHDGGHQGADPTPAPPPPPVPAPADERPAAEPSRAAPACRWCREPLPRRDNLHYCPFCGADLHTAPCPTCGEELEVDWRFCVSCGTSVGDGD